MLEQAISRRLACALLAGAPLGVVTAGCVTRGKPRERAALTGVLWWVSEPDAHRPVGRWHRDLDQLQELGIDLLIFTGPFVGEQFPKGIPDPMAVLFKELDRRNMRVYLDTLQAPQWWTLDDPGPEVARACERVHMLHNRYGEFACFEGFYIPYELYVFWDAQAERIRTLYREIAACCKATDPQRRTLISPFFILDRKGVFGDFRWASPKEYERFWTGTLGQAEIDIVALQDSGEHVSYYTMEDRRPFFRAMKRACDETGTEFWANVETGELLVGGPREFIRRFGEKTHVNNPVTHPYWRGVPAEKLVRKLEFVRPYTRTAITWGYREYVRPSLGPEAAALYVDYYVALTGSPKPRR